MIQILCSHRQIKKQKIIYSEIQNQSQVIHHLFIIYYNTNFLYLSKMSNSKIIYISNIHSPLAFHIIEALRNDHLQLQNYTLFVGSDQGETTPKWHPSVTRVYHVDKEDMLFCRALLQCSVFVMNLEQIGKQLQLAIRSIQERGRNNQPTQVIGLSSFMAWSNSKPICQNLERKDKEQVLRIIKESCKFKLSDQRQYSASEYLERRPSHFYQPVYWIQKLILDLNKNQNTKATIICCGLIYGKNFPEKWLHRKIATAYNLESLVCWGNGNNFVPLVHIDKLLFYIDTVLKSAQCPEYCIAVNNTPQRQIQILRSIQKYSGNFRKIEFKELAYESLTEIMFSTNLVLKPSLPIESQRDYSTFQQYLSEAGAEIHEWLEINPVHVIIDYQGIEICQGWRSVLGQYYKVHEIGEEELQSLRNENENLSDEEIIEKYFFIPFEKSHFIIVMSKSINISEETLQKHNIFRMTEPKELQHNYQLDISNPVGWEKLKIPIPSNFVEESKSTSSHCQKKEASSEIEIEQPIEQKQGWFHQKKDEKSESQNEDKQKEETEKKTSKIDQYILDNVTPYLAQAYFKCKGKLTLICLIQSLKDIYEREMKQFLDD